MNCRAGTSLVELITALTLLGLVAIVCALLVRAQAGLLRHTTEMAASEEVLRSAAAVLRGELRDISAADLRAVTADSVALRVFRGWAVVCDADDDRVSLRYRGMREPDPLKDSLLVAGEERVLAFQESAALPSATCLARGDEQLLSIRSSARLHHGSVLLLFESGAYHLAAGALRYRRGAEGRQPLTDQLIEDRASRFIPAAGGIGMVLQTRDGRRSADTRIGVANP